jgi:hypothetical protein
MWLKPNYIVGFLTPDLSLGLEKAKNNMNFSKVPKEFLWENPLDRSKSCQSFNPWVR